MRMKLLGVAVLALGTIGVSASAEARDGCGPGFHRGYYGYCRPNLRPYGYGPGFYGRPIVYGGYGWRRPYGWRHAGWGGPGWHRPGWHRVGWGGHGWHHGWHRW